MSEECPDCGETARIREGTECPNCGHDFPGPDLPLSVDPYSIARKYVTENVRNLFYAEIANERDGGVTPSTLFSTVDSVHQAPDIMCDGWFCTDWAELLWLLATLGPDTEVRDLL